MMFPLEMREETDCKPPWHDSPPPPLQLVPPCLLTVSCGSTGEGTATRKMEGDVQREGWRRRRGDAMFSSPGQTDPGRGEVRDRHMRGDASGTGRQAREQKQRRSFETEFQRWLTSLVAMATTHLNKHLIAAVCT